MHDIVKICTKHGELNSTQCYYRASRNSYECRECMRDSEKRRPKRKYEGEFAEYHRNHARKWRQENKDYLNQLIRDDRKSNPEKYRERERKQYHKNLDRNRYLDVLNKHKLTPEKYNQMIENQKGLCAICNLQEVRINKMGTGITRLSIDHCHITQKVRGLLCHACNVALGSFKDSISILQSAIEYLQSHQHQE